MFLPSLTRKKNLPRTRCRQCLSVLFPSVMIARAGRINASGCLLLTGPDFQIPQNKNSLHLNAIYDIKNRFYVAAAAENLTVCDEGSTLLQMLRRSEIKSAILLADRGYDGYDMLAEIQEKGWKFLVRVRDGVKGIVQGLDIPEIEEFDADFNVKLARRGDKFLKKHICSRKKEKDRLR